jgi:hypothetical protein
MQGVIGLGRIAQASETGVSLKSLACERTRAKTGGNRAGSAAALPG